MASNNNTNVREVNSTSTVIDMRKQGLLEYLKHVEETIYNCEQPFGAKVKVVIRAWQHISVYIIDAPRENTEDLIDWVHCHTLNILLQGDWSNFSDNSKIELHTLLSNCMNNLQEHQNCYHKCEILQGLIFKPWGHPTLVRMINPKETVDINDELDYLCLERGHIITNRLQKLLESKCEDLALHFAECCLRCIRLPCKSKIREYFSNEQINFILDVYIGLLFKFNHTQKCITELSRLDLREGLDCIQRFTNKHTEGNSIKLWKQCQKVAGLAAQVFVASAMVKPHRDGDVFSDLMSEWVKLHNKISNLCMLPDMVRKLIQAAESAAHIYTCCKVLTAQFGENMRLLTIELYIRALTTDMNELESRKTEGDTDNVQETELRLSNGFLSLADLFKNDMGVCRECILTSFSLNPTRGIFERIKAMAIACGKLQITNNSEGNTTKPNISSANSNDSASMFVDTGQECCQVCLHPVVDIGHEGPIELCAVCGKYMSPVSPLIQRERTLDALISIKGDTVTQSINYNVLSAPNQVLDANVLNLPPHLCADLAVVISSPRIKMFSWVLDWSELNMMCEKYMNDIEGTRCRTKELKYLNIDYSQFKDRTGDGDVRGASYGIEKGYEQCVEVSESESELYQEEEYNSNDKYKFINEATSASDIVSRPDIHQRKIHIAHSDSDGSSAKHRTDTKIYHGSSLYDCDTLSQNSLSESLGSDGLQDKISFNKTKHSAISNVDDIPRFNVAMQNEKDHVGKDLEKHFGNGNVNCKSLGEMFLPSRSQSDIPEKNSSDPSVVQSLRMFRPSPTKVRNIIKKINSCSDIKEMHNKYAPMLSELDLNPRVILIDDCKNYNNQTRYDSSLKTKKDISFSNHTNVLNNNQDKSAYTSSKHMESRCKLDNLTKVVCGSNNILADVPGLSSFEMIIPERVESVVQMVQLAQNAPKRSSASQVKVSSPTSIINSLSSTSQGTTTQPPAVESEPPVPEPVPSPISTPVTAHIQRVGQPIVHDEMASNLLRHASAPIHATKESELEQSTSSNSNITMTSFGIDSGQNIPTTHSSIILSEPPQLIITNQVTPATSVPLQNVTSVVTPSRQKLVNPAIVNLLSNHILVPARSPNPPKNPTIINILSQKILRPPYSTTVTSQGQIVNAIQSSPQLTNNVGPVSPQSQTTPSAPQISVPVSAHPIVQNLSQPSTVQTPQASVVTHAPAPQQILQILNSTPVKPGSAQIIKGVNIMTNVTNSPSSDSKMVQFICKTDGKTFQFTPFPGPSGNIRFQTVETNRSTTKLTSAQLQKTICNNEPPVGINTRSVYEENYAKFIQTANKTAAVQTTVTTKSLPTTTGSSVAAITTCMSQNTSLPKFNQAFGKTIYQVSQPSQVLETSTSDISGSEEISTMRTTSTVTGASVGSLTFSKVMRTECQSLSPVVPTKQLLRSGSPLILKRATLPSPGALVSTVSSANKTAMTPLSVQTVQGSVIYTRQIPISTCPNVITPTLNRSPVLKIAQGTSEVQTIQSLPIVSVAIPAPIVVSKNSVIRNKMNTLLATTFTTPTVTSIITGGTTFTTQTNTTQAVTQPAEECESCDVDSSSDEGTPTSVPQQLYTLQTGVPIKLTVPSTVMFPAAKVVGPVLQIPGKLISSTNTHQQVVLTTTTPAATARLPPNIRLSENLVTPGPIDSSVSSSTLEQLREFDLVLEQVKERSTVQPGGSTPTPPLATTSAGPPPAPPTHGLLISPAQSESVPILTNTELTVSAGSSYEREVIFTATGSPITQRLNFTYVSQNLAKLTSTTPVVVVTNYQQAPSPALSVTSQSSSSPCVTPAPLTLNTSAGKTQGKVSSKSSKRTSVKTSSTNTSKASPVPKPPQKPQEDEQTAQRIYDILAEYAEQLRNSPDLNNKPAPRRRSNPPTNPGQSSKRKKSSGSKKSSQGTSTASEMSPGADDPRTMESEDSSCGVVQISVQDSPSQGIPSVEEHSIHGDISSDLGNIRNVQSDSNDGSVASETRMQPTRHLIFSEPGTSQPRNVIITESAMSDALAQVGKISNTTVLVPGNYLLPMSMVKGGQQITIVSGGSKLLATVPTVRAGPNANTLVLQSFINQTQKPVITPQTVKSLRIPTIHTVTGISQQSNISVSNQSLVQNISANSFGQTISLGEMNKTSLTNTEPSTSVPAVQNTIVINTSTSSINLLQRNTTTNLVESNMNTIITNSQGLVRTYPVPKVSHSSDSSGICLETPTRSLHLMDEQKDSKLESNDAVPPTQNTFTLSLTPQRDASVISQSIFTRSNESEAPALSPKGVKRKLTDICHQETHLNSRLQEKESSSVLIVSEPVKIAIDNDVKSSSSDCNESQPVVVQEQRLQSVLMTTSRNLSNGPLLSQSSDALYQDTTTNISSSADSRESGASNPSKEFAIRNGGKVGNGVQNQQESPWRYIPASSTRGSEYLSTSLSYQSSLNQPHKLFRDNLETVDGSSRIVQMMDKSSDVDIGVRPQFQSQTRSHVGQKRYHNMTNYTYPGKMSGKTTTGNQQMDKEIMQLSLERKQAALERELRLQKSLSEECEDLGVDEPSTSDLFPEADLLFDPTHSPSFDQTSQDATCSQSVVKNYTTSNFQPLDLSSNSNDTDFAKEAPEIIMKLDKSGQDESFLLEHHASKHILSSAADSESAGVDTRTDSGSDGAPLRSPTIFVDIAHSVKNTNSTTEFHGDNDEYLFSTTSLPKSSDESCANLTFEERNSSKPLKNGAQKNISTNLNSNSTFSDSSCEAIPALPSDTLPSPVVFSNKFFVKNPRSYSNRRRQQRPQEMRRNICLKTVACLKERSTSEEDVQFTSDDTSQSIGRISRASQNVADNDSTSQESTTPDSFLRVISTSDKTCDPEGNDQISRICSPIWNVPKDSTWDSSNRDCLSDTVGVELHSQSSVQQLGSSENGFESTIVPSKTELVANSTNAYRSFPQYTIEYKTSSKMKDIKTAKRSTKNKGICTPVKLVSNTEETGLLSTNARFRNKQNMEQDDTGGTRRLSPRSHVKKNCPCCNGSSTADIVPSKKARIKDKLEKATGRRTASTGGKTISRIASNKRR